MILQRHHYFQNIQSLLTTASGLIHSRRLLRISFEIRPAVHEIHKVVHNYFGAINTRLGRIRFLGLQHLILIHRLKCVIARLERPQPVSKVTLELSLKGILPVRFDFVMLELERMHPLQATVY